MAIPKHSGGYCRPDTRALAPSADTLANQCHLHPGIVPTQAHVMAPQAPEFASPSTHGTPVYLTVWDLLPPSRWASLAYSCGFGVLHTDVWLPDAATEWGYGGHDVASVTGIFALPREGQAGRPADGLSKLGPRQIPPPGPSPLPDARYVGSWFIGYAGAPQIPEASSEDTQTSAAGNLASTPCLPAGSRLDRPNKETGRWAAPQSGWSAYLEPRVGAGDASTGAGNRKNDARHRGARARSLNWSLRLIMEMKEDPHYYGTNYDLLARNCNHFSDALLFKLTGARLPGWINRAAWVGAAVTSFIPQGLLELQTGIEPEEGSVSDMDDSHDSPKVRPNEVEGVGRVQSDSAASNGPDTSSRDRPGISQVMFTIAHAEGADKAARAAHDSASVKGSSGKL